MLSVGRTLLAGVVAVSVIVLVIYLARRLFLLNSRVRRSFGGLIGVAEEVFAPARHQAREVQEVHQQFPAPPPTPGDPPNDPLDGADDRMAPLSPPAACAVAWHVYSQAIER